MLLATLLPDLRGDWCDVQDGATQWGQTVNVQKVVVQNAGAGSASPFKMQWYLSKDKYGGSGDILLAQANGATTYSHGGIAANSYGPEFGVNLKLPASLPSGWSGSNFYVVMKTDSSNQVAESNESNNFGGTNDATYDWDFVTINNPLPDLKGDWCDVQDSPVKWGQSVTVQTVSIQNAGEGAAGAFKLQWYLSKDKYGGSGDILLAQTNGATTYSHGGIASNSYGPQFSVNLQLPGTLPSGWSGSGFFIVMKTDSSNQVAETNEGNNFGGANDATYDWDVITINNPLADLSGDWCDVQDAPTQWGQSVTLPQVSIHNGGEGAAGAFKLQWYLSKDKYGGSGDILLAQTNGSTTYSHAGIAANTYGPQFSVSLKLPTTLPSGWSGSSFYIVMKTDSSNQVAETNESNNFGGANDATYDWDFVTINAPATQVVKLTNVPFVTQIIGGENMLCQFASAAMLMGQKYGSGYATKAVMQDLSREAGKGDIGGSGADVEEAANATKSYLAKQGISANTTAGWLSFNEIKQALQNGRAVSVSLTYELLGSARADWYKTKNIKVGGHQVVIIGFDEIKGEWTFYDPLQPSSRKTTVSSDVFREAVKDFAKHGEDARGWYFQ